MNDNTSVRTGLSTLTNVTATESISTPALKPCSPVYAGPEECHILPDIIMNLESAKPIISQCSRGKMYLAEYNNEKELYKINVMKVHPNNTFETYHYKDTRPYHHLYIFLMLTRSLRMIKDQELSGGAVWNVYLINSILPQ